MKKFLIASLFTLLMGLHCIVDGAPMRETQEVLAKETKNKSDLSSSQHASPSVKLKPAYPWEVIKNNTKTFRFIVMNFYTDLFDPKTVKEVAKNIQDYVETFVYPSWRYKITVEFFIPPSQARLEEQGLGQNSGVFINAIPQPGTFIPIVLTNNFSDNIPNDFAAAVHGNVSGSETTGYNASLYLDGDFYTLTGPFPFGTPFIVIPAGTAESGNGINGVIAANEASGEGPTDFYQALSLVMSQEVISLLIDPTAAQYIASGNPLGSPSGGPLPKGTSGITTNQSFYLKDATAPFLYGDDNIVDFNGWPVGNFALPAYFMPYDASGCYDLLGRTCAPLTPYKGNQFVIYQNFFVTNYPKGKITDLLVGNYVSSLARPKRIHLIEGGSIYKYEGWDQQVLTEVPNTKGTFSLASGEKKSATIVKHIPTVTKSQIANGRNRNSKQFEEGIAEAKESKRCSTCQKSTQPHLLPFQFIDDKGRLTARFAIINYIPEVLPPEEVEKSLPVLEKYINEQYLPYYNSRAEVKNYTVLPGDIGLPEFDGTFIPFFMLSVDQMDPSKRFIGGGAANQNNVPDVIVGPLISEWIRATPDFSVPNLPLANPYLIFPVFNFTGQVTVTTDQPGLGPFTAIPTGSSLLIPTTFPIVALGENSNPLDACSPLENDLTGKIGINLRTNCDSLVYPNVMADAGAIAFLTVFDGGATAFSAPGAEIWGATIGPDGNALIDALAQNQDITITISAPTPSILDIQTFTNIAAHEVAELLSDSNYATYVLTFKPFVDEAVLFSQYEASDPVEGLSVIATKNKRTRSMDCFPLPSYFVAYLRNNNYDNTGVVWRALIPESRQQTQVHFKSRKPKPIHMAQVLGATENGFDPDNLFLEDNGSIFAPSTFYPPFKPSVISPIFETPLNTIYERLKELEDVLFI